MSTQVVCRELILAYDGACPMCTSTVALLVRYGLVRPEQAVSNEALPADELEAAQAAGLRNQLVVLDRGSHAARAGIPALLWIVGENFAWPWWVRVLSLPGVRHLLSAFYETISYNRRVISPPRRSVRCDCEPQVTTAMRLRLIVPLTVFVLTTAALVGAGVFLGSGLGTTAQGAILAPVVLGAGWAALVVAAILLLRGEQRIDYVAHLAVTAFVGALVLWPLGLVGWWLPEQGIALVGAALATLALALMFRMQRRRVVAVGLGSSWLWAWTLLVTAPPVLAYSAAWLARG
ncbi:MAG: DCC1-like thiol-disulfide oxidoreductase family protein [Pirellulales bacterium]